MAQDHSHHDHGGSDHPHPLENWHPHEHAAEQVPLMEEELDPANRSLSEALRISFSLLRLVMIVLVVFFLLSGLRQVEENQVALRVHFGALQGDWVIDSQTGERVAFQPQVLERGLHWSWPEPIDHIIVIPTSQQKMQLNRSFWFDVPPGEEGRDLEDMPPARGGLVPGRDGSLLTSDKNLVHGQWSVQYRVDPRLAPRFVQNVGAMREDRLVLDETQRLMEQAQLLVRSAVEHALLQVVANTPVDAFVVKNVDNQEARRLAQATLDSLDSGIVIDAVLMDRGTVPLNVRPAFQAVGDALSERAQKIEQARKEASQVLNGVAGGGHALLIAAIDYYEWAREREMLPAVEAAERAISNLLDGEPAGEAIQPLAGLDDLPGVIERMLANENPRLAGVEVSGRASELIRGAQTYRTQVVEAVRAEVDEFRRQYEKFQGSATLRRITVDRLWEQARQEVFTGDVETFYLPEDPDKTVYIEGSRDPRVQQERERRRYQQTIEQAGE